MIIHPLPVAATLFLASEGLGYSRTKERLLLYHVKTARLVLKDPGRNSHEDLSHQSCQIIPARKHFTAGSIFEGNSLDLKALLARHLRELEQPVITDYDLSMALFHFHSSKKYCSEALGLSAPFPPWQEACATSVQPLIDLGILCPHKDFPEGRVFTIIGNRYQEPGDIACSVDPFAYLSHISEMEYHGLTNRSPKLLFISAPPPKEWSAFAAQKMEKDGRGLLAEDLKGQTPRVDQPPLRQDPQDPDYPLCQHPSGGLQDR
jgi:hypothetical protein